MNRKARVMSRVSTVALTFALVVGCGKKPSPDSQSSTEDPKIAEAKKSSRDNLIHIGGAVISCCHPKGLSAGFFGPDGKKPGFRRRCGHSSMLEGRDSLQRVQARPAVGQRTQQETHRKDAQGVRLRPGKEPTEGLTYYRAFVGNETAMPAPNPGKPGEMALGLRWPDGLADGLSNTVLIGEAANPVVWTKPDEARM